MRAGGLAILLAACAGSDAPEPVNPITIAAIEQRSSPKPLCIDPPDDEPASIEHATVEGTTIRYCVGTSVDRCFSYERVSGKLSRLRGQPQGQSPAIQEGAHLETTNPELKVCTGGRCKTLTPQVWPGAAPLRAATNGSVVAVMLGDAEAGKGYVEVFDVMKMKRLTRFRFARGEFKCGDLGMLGDTIYVGVRSCTKPSGRAALYTMKGRKIANVGGKADFGMFGNAYTQVEDNVWAFLEENGHRVVLQDVVKGKVVKTIDTSALFESAAATFGNPGESAIIRVRGGVLAVIAGTPANGSIALIDVMAGKAEIRRAPLCP